MRKILIFGDIAALPRIIYRNYSLLCQFVKRNIDSRYRGSFLGILWSFIQPLLMLCIYTFVFSVIFKPRWAIGNDFGRGSFAVIMLCGMSFYQVFSETMNSCSRLIINRPGFVKKVVFPLEILPLAQTLSISILGSVWIILLFLGSIFIIGKISFMQLLLPLVLLPFFLMTLGFAYFIASLGVYIRDISHLTGVVLQILFYMTPIFYPIQAVPERFRWIIYLNPLAMLIEQARKVFLYSKLPDWDILGILFLVSVVIMQLGLLWFLKTKKGFADVI